MLAIISMRKRELFTLVLLPQLCDGGNLDEVERELFTLILLPQLCDYGNLKEEERVVYFGFVAPTM